MSAELTRANAIADQHPGEMGVIGQTVNDYGTPVSVVRCADCGTVITVCPVTSSEQWGDGCLAEGCTSYDIERDIEIFYEALADHGLIVQDES